jgi:probable phosphoglycerate mutase
VIVAYIDGGARGNPGPAGYGVRIEDAEGGLVEELHGPLGIATNNVAEYSGLIAALRHAAARGAREVQIRADSELLVKQMRGEYRVKNERLKPLFLEACSLVRRIGHVTFTHVPRVQNAEADRLSNLAMDEAEAQLKADESRLSSTSE